MFEKYKAYTYTNEPIGRKQKNIGRKHKVNTNR